MEIDINKLSPLARVAVCRTIFRRFIQEGKYKSKVKSDVIDISKDYSSLIDGDFRMPYELSFEECHYNPDFNENIASDIYYRDLTSLCEYLKLSPDECNFVPVNWIKIPKGDYVVKLKSGFRAVDTFKGKKFERYNDDIEFVMLPKLGL